MSSARSRTRAEPRTTRTTSRRWPRRSPSRTIVVGAEGLGGPSWQEPAAVEVGADLDRRGAERDVPAAFLTGIVLAGVALVALLIGEGVFALVAARRRPDRAGRAVRGHGEAPPAAGDRRGTGERRVGARRRVLPRRGGAPVDAVARPAGDLPLVHDGPGASPQGHRREHRPHRCSGCCGSPVWPARC